MPEKDRSSGWRLVRAWLCASMGAGRLQSLPSVPDAICARLIAVRVPKAPRRPVWRPTVLRRHGNSAAFRPVKPAGTAACRPVACPARPATEWIGGLRGAQMPLVRQ